MRCQAPEANAEGFDAPRRGVLGAGAALAVSSLLELGAPQRAGAKVVSSDWELVRRQPAGSASQLLCSTRCLFCGRLGVPDCSLVLRRCSALGAHVRCRGGAAALAAYVLLAQGPEVSQMCLVEGLRFFIYL